jgi:REP element-mobilizing transposase RayT
MPILTPEISDQVYRCIQAECRQLNVDVGAIGGTEDHVHVLVRVPATLSVAALVKQAKGSSSHLVNKIIKPDSEFKWQGAYAAFTVSKSLVPIVRVYINNQEEHHRRGTTDKDLEIAWSVPSE